MYLSPLCLSHRAPPAPAATELHYILKNKDILIMGPLIDGRQAAGGITVRGLDCYRTKKKAVASISKCVL